MQPQKEGSPEAYVRASKWGAYARFWDEHRYPCQQPPWGDLNAVDLNTGEIAWKVPLGVVDALEGKGIPKTGVPSLGGSIATAGGLVFIAGTDDHRFRAFDSRNGKELWVTQIESNGHATPITYWGSERKNSSWLSLSVRGDISIPTPPLHRSWQRTRCFLRVRLLEVSPP